jgi:proline iminopeptidase
MNIRSLSGSDLYYEISGTGWPCLVMHGGLGLDHTHFRPWLDSLGDLLQLIYFDHRGNGRSAPAQPEELTFERFTSDADGLRSRLGCERTAVLGSSFGSFIALEYAWRYPQRVSHLILVGGAPKLDYIPEALAAVARRSPPPDALAALSQPMGDTDKDFCNTWHTLLPLYFNAAFDREQAARAFEGTVYRAAAAAANPALMASYDMCERLSEIQAPVLIVCGEDDFITPPAQALRLQSGLSQAEAVVIPETGHFPFIERPQEFEAIVRAWLSNHIRPG